MKRRRKILSALLLAMLFLGAMVFQGCASSSGYHTKPLGGKHFKCK